MAGEHEVFIDLWPSTVWTDDDLGAFIALFSEAGASSSGRLSDDTRGFGLEVGIAFAAGAVAGGFFNQVGSDLYTALKGRLISMLSKGYQDSNEPRSILFPRKDRVSLSYENLGCLRHVMYTCQYGSETELTSFLTSLAELDKAIQRLVKAKAEPFVEPASFDLHAQFVTGQVWGWYVRLNRWTDVASNQTSRDGFVTELIWENHSITPIENASWTKLP